MRENRTYGSEGGEAKAFPTPIRADTKPLEVLGSRLRGNERNGLALRMTIKTSPATRPRPSAPASAEPSLPS